jgi:hypothetical protein
VIDDADRERLVEAGFVVAPSLTLNNITLWSRPGRDEALSTEQALRLLDEPERSKAKGRNG